eukprot:comp16869_c0_seq1/m.27531 comp16869_c0_seq1/g.27531  ORF comp16869_c0_seq1/g.27531 comp16869_c0_seq1/m.27531 type:complete len:506 (-) comp16869_c0_seq1:108-1625(-)
MAVNALARGRGNGPPGVLLHHLVEKIIELARGGLFEMTQHICVRFRGCTAQTLCASMQIGRRGCRLVGGHGLAKHAAVSELERELGNAVWADLVLLQALAAPLCVLAHRERNRLGLGQEALGCLCDLLANAVVELELQLARRRVLDRLDLGDRPHAVGIHVLHEAHDGNTVSPAVLKVERALGIRCHNERKGLVEPAVLSVGVEHVLANVDVAVDAFRVETHHKERTIDRIKDLLVAQLDELFAGLGPCVAVLCGEQPNRIAEREGLGLGVQDGADLALDRGDGQWVAVLFQGVDGEEAILVQHDDITLAGALELVAALLGDAGRVEERGILRHVERIGLVPVSPVVGQRARVVGGHSEKLLRVGVLWLHVEHLWDDGLVAQSTGEACARVNHASCAVDLRVELCIRWVHEHHERVDINWNRVAAAQVHVEPPVADVRCVAVLKVAHHKLVVQILSFAALKQLCELFRLFDLFGCRNGRNHIDVLFECFLEFWNGQTWQRSLEMI